MAGDEQYRAWVRRRPEAEAESDMRPARLVGACPCPARDGFRELRFDLGDTTWSWCFPGEAGDSETGGSETGGSETGGSETGGSEAGAAPPRREHVRALLLRPGPHGLAVEAIPDRHEAASSPDPAAVADLVLSGTPVFVHRSLLI